MTIHVARILACGVAGQMVLAVGIVQAQAKSTPYTAMAPIEQYLSPSAEAEIALARSAAPKSISDGAEILVLGRKGYTTAVKGSNGFVCLVERSWGAGTTDPVFWNPKVRGPVCMNPPAARTSLPSLMLKTRLVLAGKSAPEIASAVRSANERKELPALEPDAMSYMMSKQQYLGDDAGVWHPHMMWFVPGDATREWGANVDGSPVMAGYIAEEHATTLMVVVDHWSDGTPATAMSH